MPMVNIGEVSVAVDHMLVAMKMGVRLGRRLVVVKMLVMRIMKVQMIMLYLFVLVRVHMFLAEK